VEQLFQPFKRLHAHHEFEGSGVGLATVSRVIRRHGGEVRGEGAVGQGAMFCFSLPEVPASD
jgi:signal transduction histidine kinase